MVVFWAFAFYANDLPDAITKSFIYMYADDTKLLHGVFYELTIICSRLMQFNIGAISGSLN